MRIWDDEANVLLAANYINALSSLNCLSLPAQPFPNTGALSCLSRMTPERLRPGRQVGGDARDRETLARQQPQSTQTRQEARQRKLRRILENGESWALAAEETGRMTDAQSGEMNLHLARSEQTPHKLDPGLSLWLIISIRTTAWWQFSFMLEGGSWVISRRKTHRGNLNWQIYISWHFKIN